MEALAHEVLSTIGKASTLAFFLIVWFDTDAFFEYIKTLRLHKVWDGNDVWQIPEYEENIRDDPDLSYIEFLNIRHNNFFTRLLSCPLCFGFWTHVFIGLVLSSFELFFVSLLLGYVVSVSYTHLTLPTKA